MGYLQVMAMPALWLLGRHHSAGQLYRPVMTVPFTSAHSSIVTCSGWHKLSLDLWDPSVWTPDGEYGKHSLGQLT